MFAKIVNQKGLGRTFFNGFIVFSPIGGDGWQIVLHDHFVTAFGVKLGIGTKPTARAANGTNFFNSLAFFFGNTGHKYFLGTGNELHYIFGTGIDTGTTGNAFI